MNQEFIDTSLIRLQAIDYLNLSLGIVHGDICPWNLLIDPETDDLKVFDFNMGAKLGWEGHDDGGAPDRDAFIYDEARNDVKLAVFTLYEIITRDMSFREENEPEELDVTMVLDKDEWKKHSDVSLEEGAEVAEYRRVLEDWVNAREATDAELKDYKQTPKFIDWPPLPEFPLVDCAGTMMRRGAELRQNLVRRGEPFIEWYAVSKLLSLGCLLTFWVRVRPPSSALPLPEGQRLLATGEVVEDKGTGRS